MPEFAQKKQTTGPLKTKELGDLQLQYDLYKQPALQIWNYTEVGYKEYKSARLLQQVLRDNGFAIDVGHVTCGTDDPVCTNLLRHKREF